MKIKKNWKLNDTVKPEDLNRIEGNIEALQAGLPEEDFTLEEKEKLASVEYGATAVSVENSLTSYSATAALSAKQGRKLKELIDERATKDKLDEQVGLAFKHTREVKAHLEGLINAEKTARESADSKLITSNEGVHGLRHNNSTLEVYINNRWRDVLKHCAVASGFANRSLTMNTHDLGLKQGLYNIGMCFTPAASTDSGGLIVISPDTEIYINDKGKTYVKGSSSKWKRLDISAGSSAPSSTLPNDEIYQVYE